VALTPAELDPEASVYAGLTTLAMAGRLAAEGGSGLLPPRELFRAVRDAAHDIGRGLGGLDAGEREQARDWLQAATDTTGPHVADALDWFGLVRGDWLA